MKFFCLLFVLAFLFGCSPDINLHKQSSEVVDYSSKRSWIYNHTAIINVDGCQYIVIHIHNGAGITHKVNCSNPIHQNNAK